MTTASPLTRRHRHHVDRAALPYRLLLGFFLLLFALFCLAPFLLVISVSFTPQSAIDQNGFQFIPEAFSLDAYKYLFQFPEMLLRAYGVSILITVVGTVLNLVLTALYAYPLSRLDFRYRRGVSLFLFITMLFSGGLVPYFILVKSYLGWENNLLVLIIPQLVVPYNVFLLRVFMQDVPEAIYESARLDGASEYTIFSRIVIPLMKPGLATVGLFIVLMYWNEVFTGKLFITDETLLPLQNVLDQFTQYIRYIMQNGAGGGLPVTADAIPSDPILFAMCLIAAGPMMFVFLFFQKYFVAGLTMGSIKN